MILHGQRMVWRLLMRVVTEIGIIVFTTNAFDSDRVNAMGVGCNAFLTKPMKKKQLLELLSLIHI